MGRSRGAWRETIAAVIVVLAVTSAWQGAAPSGAQTPPPGVQWPVTGDAWQQIPNVPADVDFRSVFMGNVNVGIAVGKQGDRGVVYTLQWMDLESGRNSLQLTPAVFSFRAPLWAGVIVDGDTWAVGEQGLIVRERNGIWEEMSGPVPGAQLLTLQMLGNGEEGWAGGFLPQPEGGRPEPVMLHYANGRWQRDQGISGEGSITALHFTQGAGWAAGDAGIWRYSQGVWTREQEPDPCPDTRCFQSYSAVRAVNNDEAWIAGSSTGLCAICTPRPYIVHRQDGRWQIAVNGGVQFDPTRPGAGRELYGLSYVDAGPNVGMRSWAVGTIRDNFDLKPFIIGHISGQAANDWTYTPYPAGVYTQLTSVSAPDVGHAMAVGTGGAILSFGYGQQPPPTLIPNPTARPTGTPAPTATPPGGRFPTQLVVDPHNPSLTYFEVVGHTLGGGFRDYWRAHGGLGQFGYPLTEEFVEISPTDGKAYVTQYFERARFEYHPENRPPYDVLLGLLGRTITAGRESEQPFLRRQPNPGKGGPMYFPETGHFLDPMLTQYWLEHGGLPVYGYPIGESFAETSPTDGKTYLVQYFERNRLEYHPELPEAYRVSLGLLGVQVLEQRGWIPVP